MLSGEIVLKNNHYFYYYEKCFRKRLNTVDGDEMFALSNSEEGLSHSQSVDQFEAEQQRCSRNYKEQQQK